MLARSYVLSRRRGNAGGELGGGRRAASLAEENLEPRRLVPTTYLPERLRRRNLGGRATFRIL